MTNFRPVSMDDDDNGESSSFNERDGDSSRSESRSTNEYTIEDTPLLGRRPNEYLRHLAENRDFTASLLGTRLGLASAMLTLEFQRLQQFASQLFLDTRMLLLEFKSWIRANPKLFTAICIGVILFALACATPAILGAIGFSSIGPVAGSIAAGWQASMGTVAAGSLFAFLQSAAMGGAAIGLFAGIGAFGGLIALVGVGASVNVGREEISRIGQVVGEKFAEAGEVLRDGAVQAGGAIAVGAVQFGGVVADGAVQVGQTVAGWWGKMTGKKERG